MTIVALGVVLALALLGHHAWWRQRAIRRAATDILRNATVIYSGAHLYREVPLAAFPHLDAAYYDAAKAVLERAGFLWLADVEDVTVTEAGGAMMPAVARVMVGDQGAMIAAIYHARTRVEGRGAASYRIAEFETPLDDGTFVLTSNAALAGALASPPEVYAEFHDDATPIATLLDRHRERLRERAGVQPGVVALPTSTLAEAIAHQERLDGIKTRFRASRQGVFSAEELQRLAPPGTASTAAKVATRLVELDTRASA